MSQERKRAGVVAIRCLLGVFIMSSGCTRSSSNSLDPLDAGRVWKYSTFITTAGGLSGSVTTEMRNMPATEWGNKRVTPRAVSQDGQDEGILFMASDKTGIEIAAEQRPTDASPEPDSSRYEVKLPAEKGVKWQDAESVNVNGRRYWAVGGCVIDATDVGVTVPTGSYEATEVSCADSNN